MPATPVGDGRSELQRRRDELAAQVAELHWDLGGLAYEMAIRDHFRLDVLVQRAARLQERDAELAEVERLLRLGQDASGGALFCWQCGITLMERSPSVAAQNHGAYGAADGADATAVMDALLAPDGDAPAEAFGPAAPGARGHQ